MKNDINDSSLVIRLNAMSKQELTEFVTVAKITELASAFTGVTTILLALIFQNTILFIITGFVLYFFGNLAVGSDFALTYIKHLLETKFGDK